MSIIQGSPEWHAARRQGIGGSDAAAVLGLSKFKTPYDLYLEKIGHAQPEPETWETARGKALEPLLRQHYADTTGRVVRVPHEAVVHPKYAFMRYNPDGLSDDGRLQEFKTAAYGKEWGDVGSDEIPQEYLLQVQHGMIVTMRPVADVTVSIAGNAPKYFVVEADSALQEMIIEAEAAFWDRVQNRNAPEPITNDDVAKMHSRVNGAAVITSREIVAALNDLRIVREDLKAAEAEKEALEVKIKHFMGGNEILVDADGRTPLATWKQQAGAERIDAEALRQSEPHIAAAYTRAGELTRRFLLK